MFENLRLTLAKNAASGSVIKRLFLKTFVFFPFVKTSGYHLKVFIFKLNQIHICQTTIVEKQLRRYYVGIKKHEQIEIMANHGPFYKRIKKYKENIIKYSCGRDRECKMVRF